MDRQYVELLAEIAATPPSTSGAFAAKDFIRIVSALSNLIADPALSHPAKEEIARHLETVHAFDAEAAELVGTIYQSLVDAAGRRS